MLLAGDFFPESESPLRAGGVPEALASCELVVDDNSREGKRTCNR